MAKKKLKRGMKLAETKTLGVVVTKEID